MAEVKRIATRESYGAALVELGKKNENIVVLDADLAASTKTGMFQKQFPDRHFDCGIAEANMMSIAAGLAAAGKIPFASSFAMFAAGRAYEQVRNSIGYPHLNVKIGATHAGISVGEDGATHQCNEDIALMLSLIHISAWKTYAGSMRHLLLQSRLSQIASMERKQRPHEEKSKETDCTGCDFFACRCV